MIPHRFVALLVMASGLVACSEPPPCERLVNRLCAASGEPACTKLRAHLPTDQASCESTLGDAKALNAQLDALVAATAAGAMQPTPPPEAEQGAAPVAAPKSPAD